VLALGSEMRQGMVGRVALTIVIAGVWLSSAQAAHAQTAGDALKNLFEGGAGRGALSANATETVSSLILAQATTFPIGSSAAGFTWSFDAGLNAPKRRSQSFGPMFAERAFTTGKGRLNVALAFQHTQFVSLGGVPLSDLKSGVIYDYGASYYNFSSSVAITIQPTIVSATYGVADRVDVGVVVPIGHARVSGTNSEFWLNYSEQPGQDSFPFSGTSWGLGDVTLRTKAALFSGRGIDGAVVVDLRLPTGDPDKLLGTGQLQAKPMFIASSTFGRLTPHVNVGYTFGGSGLIFGEDRRWQGSFGDPELLSRAPSEEFNYTAGADIVASSWLTVAGDVIGRAVKHSATLTLFDSGPGESSRLTFFQISPGTLNLLLGAVGVKMNVGGPWLLNATVLFPLNSNGVKPGVTPVLGLERAF
jgi:hypothetical protein